MMQVGNIDHTRIQTEKLSKNKSSILPNVKDED